MRKKLLEFILIFLVTIINASDLIPFYTKGHQKAMGLDLRLDTPADWKREEGKRPHIVQKFSTTIGTQTVLCMLDIRAGSQELYENIKTISSASCTKDDFIKFLPPGCNLLWGNVTKLDDETAICIEITDIQERNNIKIKKHTLIYYIPYKDKFISLHFSVGGVAGNSNIDQTFIKVAPTFLRIANSFTIMSKWK